MAGLSGCFPHDASVYSLLQGILFSGLYGTWSSVDIDDGIQKLKEDK